MSKAILAIILLLTLSFAQEDWDLQFHQDTHALQIWYNGWWGNICSDLVTQESGNVICNQIAQQMGVESGEFIGYQPLSDCPIESYVLDQSQYDDGEDSTFECQGNELQLKDCASNHFQLNYAMQCVSQQCVQVDCRFHIAQNDDIQTDGEVQEQDFEEWNYIHGYTQGDVIIRGDGKLEIYQDGENHPNGESGWNNVCGENFTRADAIVTCRQWSRQQGAHGTLVDYLVDQSCSTRAAVLSGLSCRGTEGKLDECRNYGYNRNNECSPSNCVKIECSTRYGHPDEQEDDLQGVTFEDDDDSSSSDYIVEFNQKVIRLHKNK